MKDKAAKQREEIRILAAALDRYVDDWSIAVDVGANVGRWTATLARRFFTVHAFEPFSKSFKRLCAEVRGWGFDNVVCHPLAVLDREQVVTMVSPPKRTVPTARYAAPMGRETNRQLGSPMADCITLDSLKLPSCGLIKVDVEGGEMRVIAGAQETIARCRPVVIVEVIDKQLRRYDDTEIGVDGAMHLLGYERAVTQEPNRIYQWRGLKRRGKK